MQVRRSGVAAILAAGLWLCTGSSVSAVDLWSVHHGETVIQLDAGLLAKYGLSVRSGSAGDGPDSLTEVRLAVAPSDTLVALDQARFDSGEVNHPEGLIFTSATGELVTDDYIVSITGRPLDAGARLQAGLADITIDRPGRAVVLHSESVIIPAELAQMLGMPQLAGVSIGSSQTEVVFADMSGNGRPPPGDDDPASPNGGCTPSTGP